jgi:hypothetical protein
MSGKMKKGKEAMLTNSMEGLQKKEMNYNDYEVSFRRWLVSQIDSGNINPQVSGSFTKTAQSPLFPWYFSTFSLGFASREPGLECSQPTFL